MYGMQHCYRKRQARPASATGWTLWRALLRARSPPRYASEAA